MRLQVLNCRDEVLAHFAPIALPHQGETFFITARVATEVRARMGLKATGDRPSKTPRRVSAML